MSKNLQKAADWIQRQIDDLSGEHNKALVDAESLKAKIEVLKTRIAELEDVKKGILSSNGNQVDSAPLV